MPQHHQQPVVRTRIHMHDAWAHARCLIKDKHPCKMLLCEKPPAVHASLRNRDRWGHAASCSHSCNHTHTAATNKLALLWRRHPPHISTLLQTGLRALRAASIKTKRTCP